MGWFVYSQVANEITGEHSCVMLCSLDEEPENKEFIDTCWNEFRRRFIALLTGPFRNCNVSLVFAILKKLQKETGLEKRSKFGIGKLFF